MVIGDIHGAHKALVQCLDRSGFDRNADLLIGLGDICDGWDEVYECVEELLAIKNRIDIVGNHDKWFKDWLQTTVHVDSWTQGGYGTAQSYVNALNKGKIQRVPYQRGFMTSLVPADIPEAHHDFFLRQILFYKNDKRNACFVHGGWDRYKSINECRLDNPMELYWDRSLWDAAMSCSKEHKLATVDDFNEIYLGHTATTFWRYNERKTSSGIIVPAGSPITTPMHSGGVWNLDTGAGWTGKLTIMDVDTKEYWQSDLVTELYPDQAARR